MPFAVITTSHHRHDITGRIQNHWIRTIQNEPRPLSVAELIITTN